MINCIQTIETIETYSCEYLKEMSVFTAYSMIEKLNEDVNTLKAEKNQLSERVLKMTEMLAKNRVNASKALNARNAELEKLQADLSDKAYLYELMCHERTIAREALKEANDAHSISKNHWNDLMDARDHEIAHLEELLSDEYTFTANTLDIANDRESELTVKNGELQSRVDMLLELSEQQATTIRNMEQEHNDAVKNMSNELIAANARAARATEMLTAIATASTYITNVLSYRA